VPVGGDTVSSKLFYVPTIAPADQPVRWVLEYSSGFGVAADVQQVVATSPWPEIAGPDPRPCQGQRKPLCSRLAARPQPIS